jgi:hypothetical protein
MDSDYVKCRRCANLWVDRRGSRLCHECLKAINAKVELQHKKPYLDKVSFDGHKISENIHIEKNHQSTNSQEQKSSGSEDRGEEEIQ